MGALHDVAGRREVVVLRRRDLAPFVAAGIVLAGIVFTAMVSWPVPADEAGRGSILVTLLVMCYLWGPAAYVRVDAGEVVVANLLFRYRIPRHLIREVAGWDWLEVVIYLLDGRRVQVGAGNPGMNPGHRSPAGYRRQAKALTAALRDVPAASAEPAGAELVREIRYPNLLLVLVAVGACALSIAVLVLV